MDPGLVKNLEPSLYFTLHPLHIRMSSEDQRNDDK